MSRTSFQLNSRMRDGTPSAVIMLLNDICLRERRANWTISADRDNDTFAVLIEGNRRFRYLPDRWWVPWRNFDRWIVCKNAENLSQTLPATIGGSTSLELVGWHPLVPWAGSPTGDVTYSTDRRLEDRDLSVEKLQNKTKCKQNWTTESRSRTKIGDRYFRHRQGDRTSSQVSNQCGDVGNPSQEDSMLSWTDSTVESLRFGWDTCRTERSEEPKTYAAETRTITRDRTVASLDREVLAEGAVEWRVNWMDEIDPTEIDRRFVPVRFSWSEYFLLFAIPRCVAHKVGHVDRDPPSQSYVGFAMETVVAGKSHGHDAEATTEDSSRTRSSSLNLLKIESDDSGGESSVAMRRNREIDSDTMHSTGHRTNGGAEEVCPLLVWE